jgi:hypothetical protein
VRNPDGTLRNKYSWLQSFKPKPYSPVSAKNKFPKTGGYVKNRDFTSYPYGMHDLARLRRPDLTRHDLARLRRPDLTRHNLARLR